MTLLRLRQLTLSVAPIVFLVIALLTPMAYASPPDPSWIRGVYDGDDFDDIIVLVTSGAGIVDPAWLTELRPLPPPAILPVQRADSFAAAPSPSSLHSRAPPSQ